MSLLPTPKQFPISILLVASEAFLEKTIHEMTQNSSRVTGQLFLLYPLRS